MTVPGIVQSELRGEEILERVPISGGDELFVTESYSLIYRAEGLLSDESTMTLSHDATRVSVSRGRRKTSLVLEYALEDPVECAIPADRLDDVLKPILAGVLRANGVADADESILALYRLSELTLVLTGQRLIKQVGEAVWDADEFEQYRFVDLTNLSFEEGDVATQLVLQIDGHQHRIKAPNDVAGNIRERLQRAVFAVHDVESLAELNATLGDDEDADESAPDDGGNLDFGGGVDPLDAGGDDRRADAGSAAAGAAGRDRDGSAGARHGVDGEPATTGSGRLDGASGSADVRDGSNRAVLERLDRLERTIERQSQRLDDQQRTIERLIEELRQSR